ncbi:MAG: septation protein SepH, partial [Actinomycetota bacterium]
MSGEPSPTDRVQKLHLVGVTTDHEGLILSARRGARSGGYVLVIDDALEDAVDELRQRRAEDDLDEGQEPEPRTPRVESALPVREIQARLRQGRSIAEVAKAAGVDPEWVDRFAAPILAERAQVIARVRAMPLRRARLGPSAQPIGEAVRRHLADRGVSLTDDEFGDAWVARQIADGRWAVRFSFHHRNRNHVLRFDLDDTTGEVSAADRASGQLGYVAPPVASDAAKRARRKPKPLPAARSSVKRPVVSTGFRPESAGAKPVSRSAQERQRAAAAMRKAAAQRAAEAERAASRRARERAAEAARKERERKAAAAKAERDQRERERARAAEERAKAAAAKAKRAA